MALPILTPVLVLIAWSHVVMFWLYGYRLPAINKQKVEPEKLKTMYKDELNKIVGHQARWVSDNYTHLMEQPTVFYALVFTLVLNDQANSLQVTSAWSYVVLRIIHSIVHCTSNNVAVRFSVFILSWFTLMFMTFIALVNVFA